MIDSQQPTLFADLDEGSGETQSADDTKKSKRTKIKTPLSSKQQLSTTIKSVRDLLRKDAGLSGDTDRLQQLTWLLFLKNLDDFERTQEALLGDEYVPIIEEPYRWRDWVID